MGINNLLSLIWYLSIIDLTLVLTTLLLYIDNNPPPLFKTIKEFDEIPYY